VAEHLGCFQGVLGGDGKRVAGRRWLQVVLRACGTGPFDYAGCGAGLPTSRRPRQLLLVNPARRLATAFAESPDCRILREPRGAVVYLRAMRVHQWLKNMLVFLPLLTRQEWHQPAQVLAAGYGFLAFSMAASAIYLVNDLLDLPADRRHPEKRHRPLAAGEVPLWHGGGLALALIAGAVGLALRLPGPFLGVLLVYLAVTIAYSFYLKKVVMVDVVTLAGLYTLRVVAGSAAIDIAPSFWLLAFSMFAFFSLALVKRYAEIAALGVQRGSARGRDYRRSDLINLYSLGSASGYLSVLVLALFINSPELVNDYDHPEALWLLCPILLYWISRIWIKAGRGEMQEDPLVFAVRDRGSRYVLLACTVIVLLAQ
jgi:4-hydroxybenzoate polyprenyltransferase